MIVFHIYSNNNNKYNIVSKEKLFKSFNGNISFNINILLIIIYNKSYNLVI